MYTWVYVTIFRHEESYMNISLPFTEVTDIEMTTEISKTKSNAWTKLRVWSLNLTRWQSDVAVYLFIFVFELSSLVSNLSIYCFIFIFKTDFFMKYTRNDQHVGICMYLLNCCQSLGLLICVNRILLHSRYPHYPI